MVSELSNASGHIKIGSRSLELASAKRSCCAGGVPIRLSDCITKSDLNFNPRLMYIDQTHTNSEWYLGPLTARRDYRPVVAIASCVDWVAQLWGVLNYFADRKNLSDYIMLDM